VLNGRDIIRDVNSRRHCESSPQYHLIEPLRSRRTLLSAFLPNKTLSVVEGTSAATHFHRATRDERGITIPLRILSDGRGLTSPVRPETHRSLGYRGPTNALNRRWSPKRLCRGAKGDETILSGAATDFNCTCIRKHQGTNIARRAVGMIATRACGDCISPGAGDGRQRHLLGAGGDDECPLNRPENGNDFDARRERPGLIEGGKGNEWAQREVPGGNVQDLWRDGDDTL